MEGEQWSGVEGVDWSTTGENIRGGSGLFCLGLGDIRVCCGLDQVHGLDKRVVCLFVYFAKTTRTTFVI